MALYDLEGMARYIYNITNSKIFIVGHSQVLNLLRTICYIFIWLLVFVFLIFYVLCFILQGTIMSLAAFTQPHIVSMVEAAALLSPISFLDHISASFVLRLVKMHIDEVCVVSFRAFPSGLICQCA